MKKHSAVLLFIAFWVQLSAQLPNGSIAPDFNVPDINGQSRHLYDILDEGKIVLLEVSATWCPPCWAYHNGHAMQNFYNIHGPLGDDKARVLFVEGDPGTNVACLYGQTGCNDYSPGDWTSGTSYPIIDNSSVAQAYQITYFPSIFAICPNKKVYTLGQLDAAGLWEHAQGCPVKKGSNNAGMFDYTPGTPLYEICDTLILAPQFTLINLGSQALTSATVQLEWNGSVVETRQWTGSLNTYGEAAVYFSPHPFSGNGEMKTSIASINGGVPDDDNANNAALNNFVVAKDFSTQKIILKIRTDSYGSETYWELRDDQGNVLDHGGNEAVGPNGGGQLGDPPMSPTAYGNNVLIKDTLDLPEDGCYSLHFVDFFGDGFCCGFGNGYYRLYNITNSASAIIFGGEFDAYDDRAFSVQSSVAASEPESLPFDMTLFPNPTLDHINLYFDLPHTAETRVFVTDIYGRTVYEQTPFESAAGETLLDIPLKHCAAGMYVLHLQVEKQMVSRVFTLVRD